MATRKDNIRTHRRTVRVRSKVKQSSGLPRISVFRSLNHIYAQLIDDQQHVTIASCSSVELKSLKGDKKAVANHVGKELAKKAIACGVQQAMFDRGSFLYHGRVKALADGLREGGLKI